jgi:hypothetical protein
VNLEAGKEVHGDGGGQVTDVDSLPASARGARPEGGQALLVNATASYELTLRDPYREVLRDPHRGEREHAIHRFPSTVRVLGADEIGILVETEVSDEEVRYFVPWANVAVLREQH